MSVITCFANNKILKKKKKKEKPFLSSIDQKLGGVLLLRVEGEEGAGGKL